MATTPNPLQLWRITRDSQYNYTVVNNTGASYTITDPDSGGGDNTAILGDIGNEQFTDSGGLGFTNTFLSVLANGQGFVAYTTGLGYYLWQYSNLFTDGQSFTTQNADFVIQCFTSGTHVETSRGSVAIEDLAVGDTAVTASGDEREVVWIGRRTLSLSGSESHMAPVQVRANAFGVGVPERDVFLSPGHPVLVRQNGVEVLVPIMNLINGTTIERSQMNEVTYWHVELDQHDVLIADGLPAESFFDMGSRAWFENDLDDVLANPDLVPAGQHGRCREVAIDGPLVEAERKRLADLFYADLAGQCAWPTPGSYAAI